MFLPYPRRIFQILQVHLLITKFEFLALRSLKSSTDLLTVIAFSFKSRHISLDETRYAPAPK